MDGEARLLDIGSTRVCSSRVCSSNTQERRYQFEDDLSNLALLCRRNRVETSSRTTQVKEWLSNRQLYFEITGKRLPATIKPSAAETVALCKAKRES